MPQRHPEHPACAVISGGPWIVRGERFDPEKSQGLRPDSVLALPGDQWRSYRATAGKYDTEINAVAAPLWITAPSVTVRAATLVRNNQRFLKR